MRAQRLSVASGQGDDRCAVPSLPPEAALPEATATPSPVASP